MKRYHLVQIRNEVSITNATCLSASKCYHAPETMHFQGEALAERIQADIDLIEDMRDGKPDPNVLSDVAKSALVKPLWAPPQDNPQWVNDPSISEGMFKIFGVKPRVVMCFHLVSGEEYVAVHFPYLMNANAVRKTFEEGIRHESVAIYPIGGGSAVAQAFSYHRSREEHDLAFGRDEDRGMRYMATKMSFQGLRRASSDAKVNPNSEKLESGEQDPFDFLREFASLDETIANFHANHCRNLEQAKRIMHKYMGEYLEANLGFLHRLNFTADADLADSLTLEEVDREIQSFRDFSLSVYANSTYEQGPTFDSSFATRGHEMIGFRDAAHILLGRIHAERGNRLVVTANQTEESANSWKRILSGAQYRMRFDLVPVYGLPNPDPDLRSVGIATDWVNLDRMNP